MGLEETYGSAAACGGAEGVGAWREAVAWLRHVPQRTDHCNQTHTASPHNTLCFLTFLKVASPSTTVSICIYQTNLVYFLKDCYTFP